MPTPEEQIQALTNQINEFKEKGIQTEALSKTVETLQTQLRDSQDREKKRELEFASKEATIEFPEIKGMESLVTGSTPDEIKTKAKALAEQIRTRDKQWQDRLAAFGANDRRNAWEKVPGSVPSHLAIGKDRQDQYEAVKKDATMGKMPKIVKLMGMHIEDMFKKHALHERAKLGI